MTCRAQAEGPEERGDKPAINLDDFEGHTPEPWLWEKSIDGIDRLYTRKPNGVWTYSAYLPQNKADEALAIAAPKLLAEVKRLREKLELANWHRNEMISIIKDDKSRMADLRKKVFELEIQEADDRCSDGSVRGYVGSVEDEVKRLRERVEELEKDNAGLRHLLYECRSFIQMTNMSVESKAPELDGSFVGGLSKAQRSVGLELIEDIDAALKAMEDK